MRVRIGLAAAGVAVLVLALSPAARAPVPRVIAAAGEVVADGYDTATVLIEGPGREPRVTAAGGTVEELERAGGKWQARVRAGIVPGRIVVRAEFPGFAAASAELHARLSANDRFEDGTPDFLRLDEGRDRLAFRRWFTWLAEAQFFQEPQKRPAEIGDCAALIRYAYREALHAHESGWAEGARVPVVPAFDSVAKYRYPYTPLGAALYRVAEGPFRAADLGSGAFAQFADAETLRRYNTHRVTREVARALPGDLLFYRQEDGAMPFHSMIYLGESQVRKDGGPFVVYHTGPGGEMRRPSVEELLRFPQPEWRPIASNPSFLGVFRWNILREVSENDDARHY